MLLKMLDLSAIILESTVLDVGYSKMPQFNIATVYVSQANEIPNF